MIPRPPPKLEDLRAGEKLIAGLGHSTILPDMDFETYSPVNLLECGAAKYTEHQDAEVLCLAYDLKDGNGRRLWTPYMELHDESQETRPYALLVHINDGGLIEAWNVAFEYWVWNNICVPEYDFPPLSPLQLRCAAAKSRAYSLPGKLENAGQVLNIQNKKDKDGMRLIRKFCIPRKPTKHDDRTRILPSEDPNDANNLYNYCLRDIQAEAEISSRVPDLSNYELRLWQCDHAINTRGIQIDIELINKCISIVEQAYAKYNEELCFITNGQVKSASKLPAFKEWLDVETLRANDVEEMLKKDLTPKVRRALEIRQTLGSASIKKLYSMLDQITNDNRLHDLFMYHAARTGRAAGNGPQPQNLPNSGPRISECSQCKKHFIDKEGCPWCGIKDYHRPSVEWNAKAVEDAIEVLHTSSLECVEMYFGDAIELISACLRGMFISAPGKDLICSDYSAIEAVVIAAIAGEQWRLDVFNTHGKIYEMSASKIMGIAFEEFELFKSTSGTQHPGRKLGKVAELASGYQGWTGAWKRFGADEFYTEQEMKEKILAWRAASPAIVSLWHGLENAANSAVRNPGIEFEYRKIVYVCKQDILYCKLLSGRYITYHKPLLSPSERGEQLSFEGWNTNPAMGAKGWIRMSTYGGKLTENVVQATARDILAHAIIQLETCGYPVVLHVHDEIVVEVPEGKGSVEEVEKIMSTMPEWAKGWPIKAKGGWRAKRYNK